MARPASTQDGRKHTTFGAKIFYRGQNITTSWVHSFGPTLLNEARLGFARNNPTLDCVECPRAPGFVESFGVKNLTVQGTGLEEGFPYFAFVNFAGVGDEGYVPVTNVEMVEKLEDNVTWTRGQHTVTVGGDLQNWQDLRQQNPYSPHGPVAAGKRTVTPTDFVAVTDSALHSFGPHPRIPSIPKTAGCSFEATIKLRCTR